MCPKMDTNIVLRVMGYTVNRSRTDNTMSKRKGSKGQITIYKTLHRQHKMEPNEPDKKPEKTSSIQYKDQFNLKQDTMNNVDKELSRFSQYLLYLLKE